MRFSFITLIHRNCVLASLQTIVDQVEEFLVVYEDLIETEEYNAKRKREEDIFTAFFEKKTQEMNTVKSTSRSLSAYLINEARIDNRVLFTEKLEEKYAEKVVQKEKELQVTLKERQELFDMAFQQDMQLYKESGIVPNMRSALIGLYFRILSKYLLTGDLKFS